MGLMYVLNVYWVILFAVGTMATMLFLDAKTANEFPPKFDMTGAQAKMVLTSPWFLGASIPVFVGLLWTSSFVRRNKIPELEHASMVWWLCNLFWFHFGCDLLSGYFQVMPVLTDLYAHMSPAHLNPRWHESRAHLDAGYILEATAEIPLCALAFLLFATRSPSRHLVEVFAAAVQFTGTITYYAPSVAKGETHCWLSYLDRSCGFVWILYPCVLLWRQLSKTSGAPASGKKKNGKAA
mmetsp:Transcript_20220/g.53645  ORF Transcript_20220/g.53645 Transcript_20220/m.53645 type:complete len:238 (-) Transcript_20220:79-792(-)